MKRTVIFLLIAAVLFGCVLFLSMISETEVVVIDNSKMPPVPRSEKYANMHAAMVYETGTVTGTELNAEEAAERLYYLGIVSGSVDENGDLTFSTDKYMTRLEAAVTVVRLLGAEEEAMLRDPVDHYVDVPEWGKPYVDYLWSEGLAVAPSAVYFNPQKMINVNVFMRYVLYALGWSFDGSDYGYELASFAGEKIGLCEASFGNVTRGEAFLIAYKALNTTVKGTDVLYSSKLVEEGRMDYNDAVFLLWSDDEKKTEQYMMLSGYQLGKLLPDGYYSVVLAENGYSMNVLADGSNSDYEGVGVSLWEKTEDVTQRFRLERTERGTYMIYAACSRGGYNRVLGFNPDTASCALYHSTSANSAEFYIRQTGDEDGSWYIVPVKRPTSFVGGSDYESGATAIVMNSQVSDERANKWVFTQLGVVTSDGEEVALFPSETVYVMQGAYESFSHSGQNAIDFVTLNGRAFCPFTGTVMRKLGYEQCNAVFVQSNSRVRYADGSLDYMTVVFMHDNYIGDLYVGQTVSQGEYFYDMGTAGYAFGMHIHIYVIRGAYYDGMPFTGSGDVNVEDALSLLPDTVRTDDYGLYWRVYRGK